MESDGLCNGKGLENGGGKVDDFLVGLKWVVWWVARQSPVVLLSHLEFALLKTLGSGRIES